MIEASAPPIEATIRGDDPDQHAGRAGDGDHAQGDDDRVAQPALRMSKETSFSACTFW